MNRCWILSNNFSASAGMILWFWLFYCWCGVSHYFICTCWTILVTLGWIQLGCGVWCFLCVIGFSFPIFCWEFLHLYSSKTLAYNFGRVVVSLSDFGIRVMVASWGLKARILKWFAILFSSGPCFVRILHHDPSVLGGTIWMSMAHGFIELDKAVINVISLISFLWLVFIADIHWIIEKAREFQKNIYFCFIDYTTVFDCVDHNKLWKILKEVGIPDHLTCLLRNLYAGQEATIRTGHGTKTSPKSGKEYIKAIYCHPIYLTYMQSTSCEMLGWIKNKLEPNCRKKYQ